MIENTQQKISEITEAMRDLLLYKNQKYGDSALKPKQILREADDEFKGMAVHKVGGMYDSVDIFKGAGKINVRIAGDSPLAIFKDIARAIPC